MKVPSRKGSDKNNHFRKAFMGENTIYKRRLFKRQALQIYETEDGQRSIVTAVLPQEAEKWKPKKLLAQMKGCLKCCPQTDRILMQPAVEKLLGASDTFLEYRDELTEELLIKFMFDEPKNVVLLPGDMETPGQQLAFFGRLLTPYLPKINHMTVLYSDRAGADVETRRIMEDDAWKTEDTDAELTYQTERILEAVDAFGEELYYEYGLVVRAESVWDYARHRREEDGRVLYLDGAFGGRMPAYSLKKGDLYLDIASSTILQTRIERLNIDIFYLSPRKYLDTIVKSGYDILTNSGR